MTTQLKNLTTTEDSVYLKKGGPYPSAWSPADAQPKSND